MSRALHIGLLGHSILETYYRSLMEGNSKEDAIESANVAIAEAFDYESPDVVSIISNRFLLYLRHWTDDDSWRIVDVEGVYRVPITDEITLGMTVDLLIEYTKGPFQGQMVVIDHKFKYNFPSPDELSMNVQLYKYIWGLQKLGYPVRFAIMNCLRYREDIVEQYKLFNRYELRPKGDQLENIIREHLAVAEEIADVKRQPVSWYANHAPRRQNPRDCEKCYFRIPCRQALLGLDESRTLATLYTPDGRQGPYKPYGY